MVLLVSTGTQANAHATLEAVIYSSAKHVSATVYARASLSQQHASAEYEWRCCPRKVQASAHAVLEVASVIQRCMLVQQSMLA